MPCNNSIPDKPRGLDHIAPSKKEKKRRELAASNHKLYYPEAPASQQAIQSVQPASQPGSPVKPRFSPRLIILRTGHMSRILRPSLGVHTGSYGSRTEHLSRRNLDDDDGTRGDTMMARATTRTALMRSRTLPSTLIHSSFFPDEGAVALCGLSLSPTH